MGRESILIICDYLKPEHRQAIERNALGWASVQSLPQTAPPERIEEALSQSTIVIGALDANLLARSPVRILLCGSVGYDAYVGRGLESKPGFTMCNASGVMAVPMAEHCLALMLALARCLHTCVKNQEGARWDQGLPWGELAGSRVCIVGLGSVGAALALRCRAMGMGVVGVRRNPAQTCPAVTELRALDDLPSALGDADHVVVAVRGGPATRGLFDRAAFGGMKPGARFYTVSRGSVTDEAALIDALTSGRLAGAGLDVFEQEPLEPKSPLWRMPNVIVTPHCAGLSDRIGDRMCELVIANLQRVRTGEPLVNTVSLA